MSDLLKRLHHGLVASCQPVDGGPMDHPDTVAAMARAAVAGGAAGLRIEGIDNLRAVRPAVDVPIIGIVKTDHAGSGVRITVSVDDVRALIEAGADIVAHDATDRPRQDPPDLILRTILQAGVMAMADCSTVADGRRALHGGATILGTTLSGYTAETEKFGSEPDFALIGDFAKLSAFVMAEGRFDTPELARRALLAGADAVTVGSSLTRLEVVTKRFSSAIEGASAQAHGVGFAIDLGGTKTAAAKIQDGQIIQRVQQQTDGTADVVSHIDLMAELLGRLGYVQGAELGVAVTGRVDRSGMWHTVNNHTLTAVQAAPLSRLLAARFGHRSIINDAAAATLAEHKLGSGKGAENFAYITVSTGVAGGLVLNGALHASADGLAGHLGFSSSRFGDTPCGCGRTGTVESIASGKAIAAAARQFGFDGSAREVFEQASSGVDWAIMLVDRSAQTIAELTADLAAIAGIKQIAIGGSVGLATGYLDRVRRHVDDLPPLFQVDIEPAALGTDAPLLGAWLMACNSN